MVPRIIPMNDTKAVLTAGQIPSFDLSKIPLTMEGKHVHVAGFLLDTTVQIIQQATTGVAVKGLEIPALYNDITLTRKPGKQTVHKLDGNSTRLLNAVKNGGVEVEPLPPNTAANGGGAPVTTAIKHRLPIMFWRPNALDPMSEVWPAGAYKKGSIALNLSNPATAFDATLTLSGAVSTTVDLYILALLLDEPWVGLDVKRYYLEDPSTSGSTVEMVQGDFSHILLGGYKFNNGGAETQTNVTLIDGSTFLPTAVPALSGDVYRHRWYADQAQNWGDTVVAGYYQSGLLGVSATVPVPQVVPVQYIPKFGKYSSGCLRTKGPWKLKTTISSPFTNKPRYIIEEVMDRDLAEIADIGDAHGIPKSKLTNVWATADGRPVQADRSKFVPMRLYDRPVKAGGRGVRAKQSPVGGV